MELAMSAKFMELVLLFLPYEVKCEQPVVRHWLDGAASYCNDHQHVLLHLFLGSSYICNLYLRSVCISIYIAEVKVY